MQQRGVNKGNNNHPDNTLHLEEESIPVSGMFGKGGHGTGHVVQLFIVFSTSIFPSGSSLDRCKKKEENTLYLAGSTGRFFSLWVPEGCLSHLFTSPEKIDWEIAEQSLNCYRHDRALSWESTSVENNASAQIEFQSKLRGVCPPWINEYIDGLRVLAT